MRSDTETFLASEGFCDKRIKSCTRAISKEQRLNVTHTTTSPLSHLLSCLLLSLLLHNLSPAFGCMTYHVWKNHIMRSAAALLFVAAVASASAQDAYNQELRGDRMLSVATVKASKASTKSSKT